jgi:hypothetical protein
MIIETIHPLHHLFHLLTQMRRANQFSLIPILKKLLNDAPLIVGSSADEHAAVCSSVFVHVVVFTLLHLRQPALTHASLSNIAINPETKLNRASSALNINPIWLPFKRFLLNPINAIFEKLADFMIVANKGSPDRFGIFIR